MLDSKEQVVPCCCEGDYRGYRITFGGPAYGAVMEERGKGYLSDSRHRIGVLEL